MQRSPGAWVRSWDYGTMQQSLGAWVRSWDYGTMQQSLVRRNSVTVFILGCVVFFVFLFQIMGNIRQQEHCTAPGSAETARLRRELRQLREENALLRKFLQRSEAKAEGWESQLSQLNQTQGKETTSLEKQIAVQEETIADLQKNNRHLSNENTKLQGDLEHCEEKFSHLEQEQENQEQGLRRMADDLQEKQREIHEGAIQASSLSEQLDWCRHNQQRKRKDDSQLTILACVYGSCLGFGSCCECS